MHNSGHSCHTYIIIDDCVCDLTFRQISKKHQIRLETPWLDPSKTLAEQEVTESDELILMFRFYYNMELGRSVSL